jgi:hypothetical protein
MALSDLPICREGAMRVVDLGIATCVVVAWFAIAPLPAEAQPVSSWPHTITEPGASVVVYQPQAISWPDHNRLTARAAIAVTPTGQTQPILGTIEVSLATKTDAQSGIVELSDPSLVATHFPALDTAQAAALQAKIGAALPHLKTRPVPLDAVLLSLGRLPASEVAVNNDPPVIFYANRPASLVVFDGEPVMAPIGKTGLTFAVNTNWDVFAENGTWYLLNNGIWLSAPAATGPYTPVMALPAAFNALPDDASFGAVRKYVPPHAPPSPDQVPTIFVSTKPAEIIVIAGPPQFTPVSGTSLLRVTNTGNSLFFDPALGRFYVLFSGRWFAASGLDGPWSFATDKLPPDFALIPAGSKEAAVLPSVPGTVPAEEAVLKAQIPTTSTLARTGTILTVNYSGAPQFAPIPGTQILYAVNTDSQVLKIGNKYYACEDGAWFVAATPTGPWALADSLPPAIATIPPASPFYNVTYVQVYSATPTTVTYGYTAGYLMGFVSAGVLVYGTGYYYPPVILPGPVPIFYPYPYTYAANVWYNSATGAWARGGTVWGPYGAASAGRYYNPTTGGWAQGAAVYGPYGGAGAWSAYNPHTDTYAHGSAVWGGGSGTANASFYNPRYGVSGTTNQNVNPYGRWGSSTVTGPNKTVNTQSRSNAQGSAGSFSSSTGAAGAGYHSRVTGNSGGVAKGANGDVYAGRDGNVYQHTDSGWSKWNNGGWTPVQPPANRSNNFGANEAGRWRSSIDQGSYRQLEQDRLGRQVGDGRFGGGRFGGGGFGGGGGRFSR